MKMLVIVRRLLVEGRQTHDCWLVSQLVLATREFRVVLKLSDANGVAVTRVTGFLRSGFAVLQGLSPSSCKNVL